jgi:Family of unknown function (DUF5947)
VSGSQRLQSRPLAALGRFVRPAAREAPVEKCEMCAQQLAPGHSHVVNIENRSLMCACRACYLLFTQAGAAQGKYKAVPDRYLSLQSVELAPEKWDSLQVPVGMAFFFFNSALQRVTGFYPSPAGATESLLPLDSWRELAASHPAIETMEADVEALLIRRGRDGGFECFLVPIDACYELTGIVRRRWRGFDGGEEARGDIDAFFGALREKSRPAGAAWS